MAALAFSACEKAAEPSGSDPDVITFSTVHPNATKVTSTSFEAGDAIGIFATGYDNGTASPLQVSGNFLNNERLTYSGTIWESARTLYWGDSALDFYAYYPYAKISSVDRHIFDIKTDQRVDGNYEASDFLHAKVVNADRSGGNVALRFKHVLSRLVVKIVRGETFVGDLPEEIGVNIYNTVTTAAVNLQIGSATKYPYGEKRTVYARRVEADVFEAVLVPQFIDTLTPLIEVNMGGIAYLLEYSISLRPGYMHTIQVVVNTSPDQEKIEISIDGTVNDWN